MLSRLSDTPRMFFFPVFNDAVVEKIDVVLPWSFLSGLCWFLIHAVYKKGCQVVLKRIFSKEAKIDRLITIYWNVCFSAATLPLAMRILSIEIDDLFEPYSFLSENAPNWLKDIPMALHTKLSFILLTGFYLNHVSQISLRKGFSNFDFVLSELLTVFFVLTFTTRCVLFGIGVVCLINVVQCSLEMARLMYCLSVISNSKFLRRVSELALLIHCALWYIVFTTIFPQYFLTAISQGFSKIDHGDFSRMSSLVLVNVTLWAFVFLQFIDSVLSRFLFEWSRGGACPTLECLLFKMKPKAEAEPHQAFSAEPNVSRNHENLRTVYQTVKCYVALKRKLKRVREKMNEQKEQGKQMSNQHE